MRGGPSAPRFGEHEIGAVRGALAELQARFRATFGDNAAPGLAARRRMPALCILRPDLSVETGSAEALALAVERDGRKRLPPRLEARVGAAVADWGERSGGQRAQDGAARRRALGAADLSAGGRRRACGSR